MSGFAVELLVMKARIGLVPAMLLMLRCGDRYWLARLVAQVADQLGVDALTLADATLRPAHELRRAR